MDEENNNEFEGFDDDSELGRLFNLLRQAKKDFLNNSGDYMTFSGKELDFKNYMDSSSFEPDSVEIHTEGNVEFKINYFYVPSENNEMNTVSTIEVNGSDEDLAKIDVQEVISRIFSDKLGVSQESMTISSSIDDLEMMSNREVSNNTGKGLNEKLQDAVKVEDYDTAAVLRDAINEVKEKITQKVQEFNQTLESGDRELGDKLLDEIRVLKNEI